MPFHETAECRLGTVVPKLGQQLRILIRHTLQMPRTDETGHGTGPWTRNSPRSIQKGDRIVLPWAMALGTVIDLGDRFRNGSVTAE
jgi:hypothetical protein